MKYMLFFSSTEAAKALNVTTRRLSNWRARGIGPACVKVKGRWKYDPQDIRDFREKLRTDPEEHGRHFVKGPAAKVLGQEDGFPIVAAARVGPENYRRGEYGRLAFRCPWCGALHTHGAGGPNLGDGDGHRVAHCGQVHHKVGPQPCFPGYIVREVENDALSGVSARTLHQMRNA
jgi:hypothetical protein